MHFAAWLGHVPLVKEFIAQGVDVNERNYNGWTPLMCAASNDHAPVVRVLLAHGADPRIVDAEDANTSDGVATVPALQTRAVLG